MAGTGSLFFRERPSHGRTERRWVATMRMPDGSRPTMACGHDHRRSDRHPCPEAVAALDTLRRIRDGLAPPDLRTLTVGRFLQRWVNRLDLAPATIRQHEMIVRVHLEPAFRGRLLTQLVPSDVDAYLARNDLDPQTLRHHRATLRRALSDAVRDGYIDRNPAALSHAPRMHKAERRYLTAAEARRLIDSSRNERLWPLWTLLVCTGLRLSEALGLSWGDITWGGNDETGSDGEHRGRLQGHRRSGDADSLRVELHGRTGPTLTVRRKLLRVEGKWATDAPKTAKSRRTITLIPQAIEALRVQQERQDADRGDRPRPLRGLVFTTETGLPIHGTNVLPPFRRALRDAGLPTELTLHGLRHSCAAILMEAGVPLPVIAEILGHSSIRVTMDIYGHLNPKHHADAARRLAEMLG